MSVGYSQVVSSRVADPGTDLAGIRIRVFWSYPDPGVLVRYGSGCFGQIRIRMSWSDPTDPVLKPSSVPNPVFKLWSDPDLVFKFGPLRIRSEHHEIRFNWVKLR